MSVGLAIAETATAVVEAVTLRRRAAVRRTIRREMNRVVAHGLYLKRQGRTERNLANVLAPLFVEQIESIVRRLRDLDGEKSINLEEWLYRYGYARIDAKKIVAAFEKWGVDEAARVIEDWNDSVHDYVDELRVVIGDWNKAKFVGSRTPAERPLTPDRPGGVELGSGGESPLDAALSGPSPVHGDKGAGDVAASLVRQVFDPKEWHDRLVDLALPVLAIEMARAGAEYLLSLGVDVRRGKSAKMSTKQRAEIGEETTASRWLNEHPGNVEHLEEMLAASGQPISVMTDMPMWMKKSIAEDLTTSFKQPYWAKIHEATAGDAERVLQRGLEEGYSIRRMANEMMGSFQGDTKKYAKMRATRIARTESGGALNSARRGSMDALAEELGPQVPMKPEWLSVLSDTTRDTHASLDGVPADENGMFDVGGYSVPWPGHYSLPPGERCNCMCTTVQPFGMDDEAARGLIQEHEERLAERPVKPEKPVQIPVANRLPPGFHSQENTLASRPGKIEQLVAGVSEKTPVAKLPEVPKIEDLLSSDDPATPIFQDFFRVGGNRYTETWEYALSRPETSGIRRQAESISHRFPEQLSRVLGTEQDVLGKRRSLSEALVTRGYLESTNPTATQQRLAEELEARLGVGHQSSLSEAMYYYTENGRSIRVATHEPKYFFEDSGVNIVPHQGNSDVELPYGCMYHPGRIADWSVRRNRKLPKVDVEAALERIGRIGGKLSGDYVRRQVTVIGLERS